jgi:2-(3-amino-3-carboxypropyl)histidine synthase
LDYDLERERVLQFLRQHGSKRAAIQLPSGLRPKLPQVAGALEEAGVEPVVMAGSCYGACDLADAEARKLGCDALLHYGHSDMGLPVCLPTLYVEARMLVDPSKAVERALPELEFKRVGLLTTVQHITHLKNIEGLLRSHGFEPFIGSPGPRAKYPGQLLGCDFGCARSIAGSVDGFLYIGTGNFHPLGAVFATGKNVLAVDPVAESSRLISPSAEDFLRRRKAAIASAASGERLGVVVSAKPGQARFSLAAELVEVFKRAGRDAQLLVVNEMKPDELMDFKFDAIVCTACPRIPLDDAELFDFPVLTPFEARVMLGLEKLEPYRMDEFGKGF